jgi:hypothetical protein
VYPNDYLVSDRPRAVLELVAEPLELTFQLRPEFRRLLCVEHQALDPPERADLSNFGDLLHELVDLAVEGG